MASRHTRRILVAAVRTRLQSVAWRGSQSRVGGDAETFRCRTAAAGSQDVFRNSGSCRRATTCQSPPQGPSRCFYTNCRIAPVRHFAWWSRGSVTGGSVGGSASDSLSEQILESMDVVSTSSHSDHGEDLRHDPSVVSSATSRELEGNKSGGDGLQVNSQGGNIDSFAVGGEMLESVTNESFGTSILNLLRLPADGVVAIVDGVHIITGAPWWLTIVGSTLAFRATIFPFTITYIRKSAQFASSVSLLPPIRPPPESGKSFAEQYRIFTKRRLELGVPSPFWTIAGFVQAPLFLYWIIALRGMAMASHPGFDTGGVLWFSNLTVPVDGALGALFPTLVAVTYFINIQVAFRTIKPRNDVSGFLMKIYQWWLEAVTIPLFLMGFYLPQGVFMYWLTNNFFNLAQSLALQNDFFRTSFGLPLLSDMEKQRAKQQTQSTDQANINPESLDLDGLLLAATQCVANDQEAEATNLLKFALEKFPDEPEVYNVYGMLHIKKRQWSEALEYYSLVMSKTQDDPPRITALMGAGIALFNQGKRREAIEVMRPLIDVNLPKEPVIRVKYLRALVTLSSAMSQEGLKEEALTVLERAAKWDSSINVYVKELKAELASPKK